MDAIQIEVVSIGGRLVGRTESDRFNLAVLGLSDLIDDGRNQASLKKARRALAKAFGSAFILTKSRFHTVEMPTPIERAALGMAA